LKRAAALSAIWTLGDLFSLPFDFLVRGIKERNEKITIVSVTTTRVMLFQPPEPPFEIVHR